MYLPFINYHELLVMGHESCRALGKAQVNKIIEYKKRNALTISYSDKNVF